MLFRNLSWALVVAVGLFLRLMASAQAPPTIEQELASKGVGSSLASLREALHNVNPDVRGFAAFMLAEKNDTVSLPAIRTALANASNPFEREQLAQALSMFGDAVANDAIRKVCDDNDAREDLRLVAANQLANSGDDSCNEAVVKILATTTDHSIRQTAMRFLKHTGSAPTYLQDSLQLGLERALRDEIADNREIAGECIVLFKLSRARAALQVAIRTEHDADVRSSLSKNLILLRKVP